jgi:CrcB protein
VSTSSALLVVLGALVGAPARYVVDLVLRAKVPGHFPLGTFVVNAVGSLLLGLVAGAVLGGGAPTWLQTLVGTGFCGALTTFSTFGFETVRLVEDGAWRLAAGYVGASLVVGLGLCAIGYAAAAAL